MISTKYVSIFIILSNFMLVHSISSYQDLLTRLHTAIETANSSIAEIHTRWQIDKYPNFLKSASMSQSSWDIMKCMFKRKIIQALTSKSSNSDAKTSLIISFMGSSVAAGHDSYFNQTYSEVVLNLLEKPLGSIGITVVSRNRAIGNNPCIPYDLCSGVYAGRDADIIHWEQTYNCQPSNREKAYVFEQFIRQALPMQHISQYSHNHTSGLHLRTNHSDSSSYIDRYTNHIPLIVFSDSIVPNWDRNICKDYVYSTNKAEDASYIDILTTNPSKICSKLNKYNQSEVWADISNIVHAYKGVGIQLWSHKHYEVYRCHGPYIADWGCCSAPWHPSILGHELVASHFAYFWLFNYREALTEVVHHMKDSSNGKIFRNIKKHIDIHTSKDMKNIPLEPLYKTRYVDNIKCFTTFVPISEASGSLLNLVIPYAVSDRVGFRVDIYENISRPDIILKARERGYLDYKYILYGNNESLPLALQLNVSRAGTSFLCQPPSEWEQHPKGFGNLWSLSPRIYITLNILKFEYLRLNLGRILTGDMRTKQVSYVHRNPEDVLESLCIEFLDEFPIGSHVLTIAPRNASNIMISYLLHP